MIKNKSDSLVFYARIALMLQAFFLSLLILYLGKILLIPLFFALLIATLLYPLTLFFERRLKRNFAAILSVLIFLTFIGSIVFFFVKQVFLFLKDLPKAQTKLMELAQDLQNWVSLKFNLDAVQQMDYFRKSASRLSSNLISSLGTTFISVTEVVVLFIFFLIFTFFILVHRRVFKNFILAFFDQSSKQKVDDVIISTRSMMNNYVVGLLTEMAILFTFILIILLVLGVKYALLIAVIAAVLNIIPYLGIYIAAAFGMLITITNGSSNLAIEVGIIFIIVHFVDANILMPHIVGGRVKINPFITIVAVFMGRLVWGVPGMFLFIPLTAIIRIISENVDELKPWSILIGEEK
ncbi:MAG: AI-2E family transporter [Ginsengibacter sp.]